MADVNDTELNDLVDSKRRACECIMQKLQCPDALKEKKMDDAQIEFYEAVWRDCISKTDSWLNAINLDPAYRYLLDSGFSASNISNMLAYFRSLGIQPSKEETYSFLLLSTEFGSSHADNKAIVNFAIHYHNYNKPEIAAYLGAFEHFIEMGFPSDQVKEALLLTKSKEEALDILCCRLDGQS